ncbi:tyrosine-type recombinase/integrase [Faecalibacter bovis]|uniref:Tyrosine-type recombinase/integrase n=1 Tax=Faecalibacter bovis TaxID=2898187 RepID=A0ABX7XAJ1_9FLAO|nr:tyrosine-type recombinase/integrase [Faecalibacter bovis]QTV04865.1 tyrosine-type recombinase/integrase [Faecalibacter bovis]
MPSLTYKVNLKKEVSSIYVRFKINQELETERKFGDFKIETKYWDSSSKNLKTRIKREYKLINTKMYEFIQFLDTQYNSDITTINFNKSNLKEWLIKQTNAFFNIEDKAEKNPLSKIYYFDEYIEHFNQNINKYKNERGNTYSSSFKSLFKQVGIKLNSFQKLYKRLKLEDVNIEFRNEFVDYLREELDFSDSTIAKYIKGIKLLCKYAENDNLPICKDYTKREFKKPSYETFDIYLNENEIQQIINLDLSTIEDLDYYRDCLIVALRVGLRYSDLEKLNSNRIIDYKDKAGNILGKYIVVKTDKTNKTVNIPLHSDIIKILDKYDNKFPVPNSNPQFNQYIKAICKRAKINEKCKGKIRQSIIINEGKKSEYKTTRNIEGFYEKWQLVKAHTTRRSFATNMFLEGHPVFEIMQITGHQTEEVFYKYIKMSPNEKIENIFKRWNKE